jgi:hypothetical protein
MKPKSTTNSVAKSKAKQAIILLLIIVIEIIGFNHQWHSLIPNIGVFFISNFILLKIVFIAVLITAISILYTKLKKKNNDPLFIVFLIKGFQVKGNDIVGIFNVVFTLCSISWIGIELYFHTFNGFLNALIFAVFMILYPLLIVSPKPDENEVYHPKILITALSKIFNSDILKKSLNEMKTENLNWEYQVFSNADGSIKKAGSVPWGPWANWDLIRKSIIEHKASFHEIILILSNEVAEDIDKLPAELKPEKLISDFIQLVYPTIEHKVKIDLRRVGVSGNDLLENGVAIDGIIQLIKHRKNEEKDILFNITGGTAAISGAMILKAIPGERKAEYARQDTGLIDAVPLDIYNVKDLWAELLEKVG